MPESTQTGGAGEAEVLRAAYDAVAPLPPDNEPPPLAAKAEDLESLRTAVVDAAGVSAGLWISYLFVLFYLLVSAGSVTHRDLFFETPVKLPFLGVDLPLKGFFWLGPVLFLIVHAYVLLHFVMLAGKVRAFDLALRAQIPDIGVRTRLRHQLPSNIFVQLLAGPRDDRNGIMGLMLWLIAVISLVIGPICLLVFFELQFLPYHHAGISWWQRIAVGLDLLLIWLFWPRIGLRGGPPDRPNWMGRVTHVIKPLITYAIMIVLTGGSAVLLLIVATFSGEDLDTWFRRQAGLPLHGMLDRLRQTLVAGAVNPASRQPESLWSNRLVLPGLDVVAHLKLDSEAKIDFLPETASLRWRNLDGAVLAGAVLRKVDFTGASLRGAVLVFADLRQARLECGVWILETTRRLEGDAPPPICADLRGATFNSAQLQGASLDGAQLQGAWLISAQLQGSSFVQAQLQNANLSGAQLQGASLAGARLRGASLNGSQLQGATLDDAHLLGASVIGAQLQGASLIGAQLYGVSLNGVQLEGATLNNSHLEGTSLSKAHLQGASLIGAQLQGALLNDANLQGANLNGAQLEGASLDNAQLQGASLVRAQLQGASLRRVFTWRANSQTAVATNARIEARSDQSDRCEEPSKLTSCEWTSDKFKQLVASIIQVVPADHGRHEAVTRIDPGLDPERLEGKDQAIAAWWDSGAGSLPSDSAYEAEVASVWQEIGCQYPGAPYVVARLTARMSGPDSPFGKDSPHPARLAAAFLNESCEGARGLPSRDAAILKKLRGPIPGLTTANPSASDFTDSNGNRH